MTVLERLPSTPSIRALAADLHDDLRSSQLVLLRYPNVALRAAWEPVILAAIDDSLAERGELYPVNTLTGFDDDEDPEGWLCRTLRPNLRACLTISRPSVFKLPCAHCQLLLIDQEGSSMP